MQKPFFSWVFILSSFVLISCGNAKSTSEIDKRADQPQVSEHTIQAVLWMQNAAEYRALSYQAFNIAHLRLDEFLEAYKASGKKVKKPAIITDIDETVLDNSPSSVKNIEDNEEYSPEEWAEWVSQKEAEEVPGAAKFLNYAKSKGVEVFYVTNRVENAEGATLINMEEVNFPYADSKHLLLRTDTGSKEDRFERVKENYEVLMYLGDNLSDFTHKFGATSTEKRNKLADKLKDKFGRKFIVLPNPIYGDWENKGIFKGKHDWNYREKDSIRRANLKSY